MKPKQNRFAAQRQRPSGIGVTRPALPVTVVRRPARVIRRCAQIAAPVMALSERPTAAASP